MFFITHFCRKEAKAPIASIEAWPLTRAKNRGRALV
jgi:hypothetical protein